MTPQVTREALNDRQVSVLHDPEVGRRHVIPLRPVAEAKVIQATFGLESSVRPWGLTADGKGMKSIRAQGIRRCRMSCLISNGDP
ncbi:MAG: hypothetical protein OXF88_19865 [Rhodobacteraceae bacterium]|nr:hypothetical protein [Paracoccaceae bacterium]